MNVADAVDSLDYGSALESAAPVVDWLDAHGRQFGLFIGGTWREPADGQHFDTTNPADGRLLARVALARAKDVDAAVAAACAAFTAWTTLGGHGRARHLHAMADHVQQHARQLAILQTLDSGRLIRGSLTDTAFTAHHFDDRAGWARMLTSEFPGYEAVGVMGCILSPNAPLISLARSVATALAAGNTVVLVPPANTPLVALRFADICEAARLPPGVVNIVTGDDRAGDLLAEHHDVDRITFSGPAASGRRLHAITAGTGTSLSLESEDATQFIVCDDADLDSVVEGVIDALADEHGTVARILVQEGIAATLKDRLGTRMAKLRAGNPLDRSADIRTGTRPDQPVETFRTHDEAVAFANDTRAMITASIWSESVNAALDLAHRVRARTVWINSTSSLDAASGCGGEADRESLRECLQPDSRPAPPTSPGATSDVVRHESDGTDNGDIHNAVMAARASSWPGLAAHRRAQILRQLADHLVAHRTDVIRGIAELSNDGARAEFDVAIERLLGFAARAERWDGRARITSPGVMNLTLHEPVGVIGVVCDDGAPMLSLVSAIAPALALGNTVVAIAGERAAMAAAGFRHVTDAFGLTAGALDIVTGRRSDLVPLLAGHHDVGSIWYFAEDALQTDVELLAASNLKRTWVAPRRTWTGAEHANSDEFLRRASVMKRICIPYGE